MNKTLKEESIKCFNGITSGIRKEVENREQLANLLENDIFHLTGSRRFGTSVAISDFDYFVKESDLKPFRDQLMSLGLRQKRWTHYGDPSVSQILEYGNIVDIQVIKDEYFDAKVKAQDLFAKLVVLNGRNISLMCKQELRDLWGTLIMVSLY